MTVAADGTAALRAMCVKLHAAHNVVMENSKHYHKTRQHVRQNDYGITRSATEFTTQDGTREEIPAESQSGGVDFCSSERGGGAVM